MTEFTELCQRQRPDIFVVLGSGMGEVAGRLRALGAIRFSEIPGMPEAGVAGHRGVLSLGEWAGRTVLLGEGRVHFYEGHDIAVIARPIQLAAALGAKFALLTNAAGGIREDLAPGSLMPVADLLEWNIADAWSTPRMPTPCDARLLELIVAAGERVGSRIPPGTYASVRGPTYETPAEVRALRSCGADAVGMSTNFELRAGVAAGMRCGALSLVTNRAAGLSTQTLNHAEVMEASRAAATRMGDWIEALMRALPPRPV